MLRPVFCSPIVVWSTELPSHRVSPQVPLCYRPAIRHRGVRCGPCRQNPRTLSKHSRHGSCRWCVSRLQAPARFPATNGGAWPAIVRVAPLLSLPAHGIRHGVAGRPFEDTPKHPARRLRRDPPISLALAERLGLPLQQNPERGPEADERKRYWNSYRKWQPPRQSSESPCLRELSFRFTQ